VRPGITGLWQVARSPNRERADFQEWIYYDTRYVEHRSLWLDAQIAWQTIRLLAGVGVSRRWRSRWSPQAAKPTLGPGPEPPVRPEPQVLTAGA